MIDCARSRQLIQEYIDGELSDARIVELRRHLAFCSACSATLTELAAVRTALRAVGRQVVEPPAGFADRVARLIDQLTPESLPHRIVGRLAKLRLPRRLGAPLQTAIYSGLAVAGYLALRAQQQHAHKAREVKV